MLAGREARKGRFDEPSAVDSCVIKADLPALRPYRRKSPFATRLMNNPGGLARC